MLIGFIIEECFCIANIENDIQLYLMVNIVALIFLVKIEVIVSLSA